MPELGYKHLDPSQEIAIFSCVGFLRRDAEVAQAEKVIAILWRKEIEHCEEWEGYFIFSEFDEIWVGWI
jgi:hypothetical protein